MFYLSPADTKHTSANRAAVFSSGDMNTQFMTEVGSALVGSACRRLRFLVPQATPCDPTFCALVLWDTETKRQAALQVFGGPEASPVLWMVRPTVVLVSNVSRACACWPTRTRQAVASEDILPIFGSLLRFAADAMVSCILTWHGFNAALAED